jgi:hypothetical protein
MRTAYRSITNQNSRVILPARSFLVLLLAAEFPQRAAALWFDLAPVICSLVKHSPELEVMSTSASIFS